MRGILSSLMSKANNLLAANKISLHNVRQEHSKLEGGSHRVNNLEKKFLVWTGKYKTVEEVPNFVGQNVVERARNRMRIRIANYMMAVTVVCCVVMVYFGKQAAARGESVSKQNLEWHDKIKADSLKEKQ